MKKRIHSSRAPGLFPLRAPGKAGAAACRGKLQSWSLYWGNNVGNTLDLSVEKGRIWQTFLQNPVYLFIGETSPARELFQMAYMSIHERELVEVTFSVLNFHILIMHAASVYAYGGSRLHASECDAMFGDGLG